MMDDINFQVSNIFCLSFCGDLFYVLNFDPASRLDPVIRYTLKMDPMLCILDIACFCDLDLTAFLKLVVVQLSGRVHHFPPRKYPFSEKNNQWE